MKANLVQESLINDSMNAENAEFAEHAEKAD